MEDIVSGINNSYNRNLPDITPSQAKAKQNKHGLIYVHNLPEPRYDARQKRHYNIGDPVLVAFQRKVFRKSYVPQYSSEVFYIHRVIGGLPVMYALIDQNGKHVRSFFYTEQLKHAPTSMQPETNNIERVISRHYSNGQVRYYVSFHGNVPNKWISQAEYDRLNKQ